MEKGIKLSPKLKKFLIKENILDEFLENITVKIDVICDISDAFLWDSSNEGFAFWFEYSNKFEDYLENN